MFKKLKNIFYYYKYYKGPYKKWSQAKHQSSGYNDKKILYRVRNSALIAKNSKNKFEVDSLIFKRPYRNKFFEKILKNLSKKKSINIIDFGGSLGSTYYRYKNIFSKKNKLQWSIIEQKSFVKIGKKEFKERNLSFYFNFKDLKLKIKNKKINIFLLSSSIQYIGNYKKIINEINSLNPDHIIFLKTPVNLLNSDRIYIEKVPKDIYGLSYPSWVFSKKKLINSFSNYKIVYDKKVKPWIYSIYFHDLLLKKND